MAYAIPIIISLIGVTIYDFNRTEKFFKIIFWGLCVYVILLFGFRDNIGYDTINMYKPYYKSFPDLFAQNIFKTFNQYPQFAPGFQGVVLIFKTLGLPWWCVQLFISGIINVTMFLFIGRHVKYRFLALLFYLTCLGITFNAEIIRQSLACSIFLMSYYTIRQKRWGVYILYVVAATLFHTSAVMLILVPLTYILKSDQARRFIVFFAVMCLTVYLIYLTLPNMSRLFGEEYSRKILYYTYILRYERNLNYYIYHSICVSVIPFMVICLYKFYFKKEIPYIHIISILPLLLPGIFAFGVAFLRLGYYFLPFFFFSISDLIGGQLRDNNRIKRFSAVLLSLAIIFSYTYEIFKSTTISEEYYPYKSILTQNSDI